MSQSSFLFSSSGGETGGGFRGAQTHRERMQRQTDRQTLDPQAWDERPLPARWARPTKLKHVRVTSKKGVPGRRLACHKVLGQKEGLGARNRQVRRFVHLVSSSSLRSSRCVFCLCVFTTGAFSKCGHRATNVGYPRNEAYNIIPISPNITKKKALGDQASYR